MIAEFIDPAYLGFILVGVMLFAIFVGFPISFTLIFLGFCIWLSRFWKISLLFNDPPVLDGHDRANTRRRPALCFYGYYDGAGWTDGKIILIISNDVG